jgi:hypothetical protein
MMIDVLKQVMIHPANGGREVADTANNRVSSGGAIQPMSEPELTLSR